MSNNWKDDQLAAQQIKIMELEEECKLISELSASQDESLEILERENAKLKEDCTEFRVQLIRLQYRLSERFEFILGQVNTDLQAEYEKSMELINKSQVADTVSDPVGLSICESSVTQSSLLERLAKNCK